MISNISDVIQVAVAPVFLLTGVGSLLSVMVSRLGRVIDRFRVLETMRPISEDIALQAINEEMDVLMKRARMIHLAIGLCTGCALLVCLVVASLFLGSVIGIDLSIPIQLFFIFSMLSLIIGLLFLLREIKLAKTSISITPK